MFRKAIPRDHDEEREAITAVDRLWDRKEWNENIRTGKEVQKAKTINCRIMAIFYPLFHTSLTYYVKDEREKTQKKDAFPLSVLPHLFFPSPVFFPSPRKQTKSPVRQLLLTSLLILLSSLRYTNPVTDTAQTTFTRDSVERS